MAQELKDVLRTVPEVRMLVNKEHVVKLMTAKEHDGGIGVRSYLQSAFTKLMATSKEGVSEAISKLKIRLNEESKVKNLCRIIDNISCSLNYLHFVFTRRLMSYSFHS